MFGWEPTQVIAYLKADGPNTFFNKIFVISYSFQTIVVMFNNNLMFVLISIYTGWLYVVGRKEDVVNLDAICSCYHLQVYDNRPYVVKADLTHVLVSEGMEVKQSQPVFAYKPEKPKRKVGLKLTSF